MKQKIKVKYREYGVFDLTDQAVYSKKHRQRYLERLPEGAIVRQLELLYELFDSALRVQKLFRQEMFALSATGAVTANRLAIKNWKACMAS